MQERKTVQDKLLTFEAINRGAQVSLSDGSVWRVGLAHIATARAGVRGDRVHVSDSQSITHPKLLTNQDRGEQVPVVQSSGSI